MRRLSLRAIAGIVAFLLPALVVLLGLCLDRSALRIDPRYAALIPPVLWSSVALGALVPAALILTSKISWPRRVGLTVAMLCLLALECGLALYIGLMVGMRF